VPAPGPRVPFALAAGTRAGARPRPKASRRKAGRKKTGGVSRRRSRGGTR
jgi:hypothetical protein